MRNRILFAISTILCAQVTLAAGFKAQAGWESFQEPERRAHSKMTHDFALSPQNADQDWWFQNPISRGNEQKVLDQVSVMMGYLEEQLPKLARVGTVGKELFTTPIALQPSLYAPPASLLLVDQSRPRQDKPVQVCFISLKDAFKDEPSGFHFRSDWPAIMVYGFDWPPEIFLAVMAHEIGHATRSRHRKKDFATFSNEWAKEEVEMHDFHGEVFDAITGGKYARLLDRILSRKKVRDAQHAMYLLTQKDLLAFEEIFHVKKPHVLIRSHLTGKVEMHLGMRWIERQPWDQSRKDQEKRSFLIWLTKPIVGASMKK